jgi:hypothetical protein
MARVNPHIQARAPRSPSLGFHILRIRRLNPLYQRKKSGGNLRVNGAPWRMVSLVGVCLFEASFRDVI